MEIPRSLRYSSKGRKTVLSQLYCSHYICTRMATKGTNTPQSYKEIGVEKMMTKMPNVFQVKINLL